MFLNVGSKVAEGIKKFKTYKPLKIKTDVEDEKDKIDKIINDVKEDVKQKEEIEQTIEKPAEKPVEVPSN